jgi:hypothetical protein
MDARLGRRLASAALVLALAATVADLCPRDRACDPVTLLPLYPTDSWQTAVKADREERIWTRDVVSGLRQAIRVAFAGRVDAPADFGLGPRKPRVV